MIVHKYILNICVKLLYNTSSPLFVLVFPDQKRCEHTCTPRHWSGFLSSFDAASAHWVRNGLWFSSLKHVICSSVPMIRVIAANCALESDISSSYRENACNYNKRQAWDKWVDNNYNMLTIGRLRLNNQVTCDINS